MHMSLSLSWFCVFAFFFFWFSRTNGHLLRMIYSIPYIHWTMISLMTWTIWRTSRWAPISYRHWQMKPHQHHHCRQQLNRILILTGNPSWTSTTCFRIQSRTICPVRHRTVDCPAIMWICECFVENFTIKPTGRSSDATKNMANLMMCLSNL